MQNIWDILTDKNDVRVLTLADGSGRCVDFEQIAVLPCNGKSDMLHAVLKPVHRLKGMADNEAIVFVVHKTAGGCRLDVETNRVALTAAASAYARLLSDDA